MGNKLNSTGVRGIKRRGNSLVIDKWVNGTHIYESLGDVSIRFAEQVLAKRIDAVNTNTYLPELRQRSLTVRDILNTYWKEHLIHLKSGKDARSLLTAIDERLGHILVSDLKRNQIDQYKRERAMDAWKQNPNKTIAPRTIQAELNQLSLALNHAEDNETIIKNPIRRFIKVKQKTPTKVMLDEGYENGQQWNELIEKANDDITPILLTLYHTGMRPGECFQMKWDWLVEKTPECYIIDVPPLLDKTWTERRIPVHPELLQVFKTLQKNKKSEIVSRRGNITKMDTSLVFPSPVNGIVRDNIDKAFRNARKLAKLDVSVTPYALRRTRLTIWDEIDSTASKYVSGHKSKESHFKNYVRITDERLFRLVGLDYKPQLKAIKAA